VGLVLDIVFWVCGTWLGVTYKGIHVTVQNRLQEEREDRIRINKIKETLAVKNGVYRSLQSQLNDPQRVRERIDKLNEKIYNLEVSRNGLLWILANGDNVAETKLSEIEGLEDELVILESKKDVNKLEKLIDQLASAGFGIDANGELVEFKDMRNDMFTEDIKKELKRKS